MQDSYFGDSFHPFNGDEPVVSPLGEAGCGLSHAVISTLSLDGLDQLRRNQKAIKEKNSIEFPHGSQRPVCGQCRKSFTRSDSLRRRRLKCTGGPRDFPCKYCPKYQGSGAFYRPDKLKQHLDQVHGQGHATPSSDAVFCRYEVCQILTPDGLQARFFTKNVELYKHVREVHRETPFQCHVLGCPRNGPHGWFRKHDRYVHHQKDHADFHPDFLKEFDENLDAVMPSFLAEYK